MQRRILPGTDLTVSEVCLGTMTWGEQNSEADAHAQLDHAIDAGVTFIDTAEMYPVPPNATTQGRTETMLGNQITEEFVNSGLGVLTERSEVVQSARDTRRNDEYTDPAFLKKLKSEQIADFYLTFTLDGMRDAGEKGYQITFELISLDTTRKVWIKTYDVLK